MFLLDLKPDFNTFNESYYPVSRINKYIFKKYLMQLVEIGLTTPVHKSEYGMAIIIIPHK